MSKLNELRTIGPWCAAATLVAAVALACAAAALASDELVGAVTLKAQVAEPTDETKPVGESAHAADGRQTPALGKSQKSARSLLRCWQDGRIIFEGRGYGALPQSQIAAELKSSDGGPGRVQVLDMYQGLCVLELPR
jgi:hypothetical protein